MTRLVSIPLKELLLISDVQGVGKKYQIIRTDEHSALILQGKGQAHPLTPSIRSRFGEHIKKRAELDFPPISV